MTSVTKIKCDTCGQEAVREDSRGWYKLYTAGPHVRVFDVCSLKCAVQQTQDPTGTILALLQNNLAQRSEGYASPYTTPTGRLLDLFRTKSPEEIAKALEARLDDPNNDAPETTVLYKGIGFPPETRR